MAQPNPQLEVFPATALADAELLRPILETAIVNPITREIFTDEIDEVIGEVERFRQGSDARYYAVAQISGGSLLGMMGLQAPNQAMREFATGNNPVELINAYVLRSARGTGAGRALVHHLEDRARATGHDELLLNSGPRYSRSGWPFWRKQYGEPAGSLPDYYGPRFDAMV